MSVKLPYNTENYIFKFFILERGFACGLLIIISVPFIIWNITLSLGTPHNILTILNVICPTFFVENKKN